MATMDYSLVVQGTDEWKQLRCGDITASRAADVIAMLKKGGEKAERAHYRGEIIAERLTGVPYWHRVTPEMEWGKMQEPFARAAYELKFHVDVDQVGFVKHPRIDRFGCSPDGLVGDEGMIQIKCPTTINHVDWMRNGTVPVEHMPQMLAEMACCERAWCDFVSFDPRLPEHLQLFVVRFDRNDKWIATIESEVEHFNAEVDQVMACLPQGPQPAAKLLEMPRQDEPITDADCPF